MFNIFYFRIFLCKKDDSFYMALRFSFSINVIIDYLNSIEYYTKMTFFKGILHVKPGNPFNVEDRRAPLQRKTD